MSTTHATGPRDTSRGPVPWHQRPLLSVDCETTGVDTTTDRIVQIAAAIILPDATVTHTWQAVINPGVPIPDEAAAIHGITTERAEAEGIAPTEALTHLADLYGDPDLRRAPTVIYNATYDWPLLLTEAARHHVDFPAALPILDPFVLDKHLTPKRAGKGMRKLTAVANLYGIEFTGQAHGALADCIAAGQLLRAMTARHPELATMTLAELHVLQARAHEEQQENFQAFMRSGDRPEFRCRPGWPLPLDRAVFA